MFNIENFLHKDALQAEPKWQGFPKYNFVADIMMKNLFVKFEEAAEK